MTFGEFKTRFYALCNREDSRLYELVIQVGNEILMNKLALDHVEIDTDAAAVLRRLDERYFIRPFSMANRDSAKIDFDDERLVFALFYRCAMFFSFDNAAFYEREYYKNLNSYCFSSEETKSLKDIITTAGYDYPYTIERTLLSKNYLFYDDFLSSLDWFLADVSRAKGLSYEKFIKLFVDYQDGKVDRQDLKALDMAMSLKSLGTYDGSSKLDR